VWQTLAERVNGHPTNREVTIVFTDLVGFSSWALRAGDDTTLGLLRQVAQVVEPPLLAAAVRSSGGWATEYWLCSRITSPLSARCERRAMH
jgi:class 3 adenylate cyclase